MYSRRCQWLLFWVLLPACAAVLSAASPLYAGTSYAPDPPTLRIPAMSTVVAAQMPDNRVALSVNVTDPDSTNLTVTFFGRPGRRDFTIVDLPDAQNYTAGLSGGNPAIFNMQTQWIVDNRMNSNIPYVAMLGDVTTDNNDAQWQNGRDAMYKLETPPADIPYGITLGNHDQTGGTTTLYNTYFGIPHFAGRSYYGGSSNGTDNDNHYDLFSTDDMNFIVVSINCGITPTSGVLTWASNILASNLSRRGIVLCHDLVSSGNPGTFTPTGQSVYNALSGNRNLFLMLGGHLPGEGQRTDTGINGNTIYSWLADYQYENNGGDGWMRLLRFSPCDNRIYVKTFSPFLNQYRTGSTSQFEVPYNMGPGCPGYQLIGTITTNSGTAAVIDWTNLNLNQIYQWYVTVSDGTLTTTSAIWDFRTSGTPTAVTLSTFLARAEDTGTPLLWTVGWIIGLLFVAGAGWGVLRRR